MDVLVETSVHLADPLFLDELDVELHDPVIDDVDGRTVRPPGTVDDSEPRQDRSILLTIDPVDGVLERVDIVEDLEELGVVEVDARGQDVHLELLAGQILGLRWTEADARRLDGHLSRLPVDELP